MTEGLRVRQKESSQRSGMEGKEVKLLGFWASPFVKRVEWALKLKGVDYEYIEEDIFNKTPLLLQLNPVRKKVPVLVHGRRAIAESFVILEYIDEAWEQEEPPLLPKDPHERAAARFWANFVEHKVFEAASNAFASKGAEQAAAAKLAAESLGKVEDELGRRGTKFFHGDEGIGLVDIAMGWIPHWLPVLEEVGCMKILCPRKFPAVTAWMASFLQHPVIQGSLPPRDRMLGYFHGRRELFTSASHGWIQLD